MRRMKDGAKYRQLYQPKDPAATGGWALRLCAIRERGRSHPLTNERTEKSAKLLPDTARYRLDNLTSQAATPSGALPFTFQGKSYSPGARQSLENDGRRDARARTGIERSEQSTNSIQYVRFLDDFSIRPVAELVDGYDSGGDSMATNYVRCPDGHQGH